MNASPRWAATKLGRRGTSSYFTPSKSNTYINAASRGNTLTSVTYTPITYGSKPVHVTWEK